MLTKDRNTPMRDGQQIAVPVAAGQNIFAGSIVMANASGYAVKGEANTALTFIGRAENAVDNVDGQNGDALINVRRGKVFKWKNLSSDRITQAHFGKSCFVADDETVASTDGTNTRSVCGVVLGVDADGVWVGQ